jgi:hypothetical protein
MKKLIVSILLAIMTINSAFADCDFSSGITPGPNKTFIYTEECHLKVGHLVQDNAIMTKQLTDLNQAISLKDLALTKSDARAQLWMSTSENLEGRLQKVDSLEKSSQWLMFGLGALTVFGAGIMAAKLIGK